MTEEENKQLGKLIFEVAKNNKDLLVDIYDRIKGILYSVGNTYYSNLEDLKDSIQDLLEQILKKAKKFRKNANACAWIMKIYKNSFINFDRHEKVEREYLEKLIEQVRSSYLSSDDYFSRYVFYNYILDNLNKFERKLFYYRFLCQLSINDVANILGKPKSTIQYRITQLEQKIRKL